MKILDKYSYDIAYKSDCERIQKLCLSHDLYVPLNVCYEIWEEYSDTYAAGWLFLYKTDEGLWNAIEKYVTSNELKPNKQQWTK